MAKVTNHRKFAITIGGADSRVTIGPGQTVDVTGWKEICDNKAVSGMLEAGDLSDYKSRQRRSGPEEESETESDSSSATG